MIDLTRRRKRARTDAPDALLARDGSRIPVWDAEASDPVDYLAGVIDQLRDTRRPDTARR